MLKQQLNIKQLLRLSPQQIQLMRLLQVPTMNLEERIEQEMEENPTLEMVSKEEKLAEKEADSADEIDVSDYYDDDAASYKLQSNNQPASSEQREYQWISESTFYGSLKEQLMILGLPEAKEMIGEYIIGNINDDGYLQRDLNAIVDDLAFSQNIYTSLEEVSEILAIIQHFDPPGVAARNLQECLLIQLEYGEESKAIRQAIQIIKEDFEDFSNTNFEKIKTRFGFSEDELQAAIKEIAKLNPKPGSLFNDHNELTQYVIPDYYLYNEGGELQLQLNAKNAPELRISHDYMEMIKSYAETKKHSKQQKEAISFIKQKMDAAKYFIDAIKLRQQTLMLCMQAILEFQYNYFLEGDESLLKPMKLKDIAEKTELDISTISRVVNNKYIQTDFGLFRLKEFFSQAATKDDGQDVSVREIKRSLVAIIDEEDKSNPYTDEQITALLKQKGFQLSRRTVAKYRDALKIPSTRERKRS